MLAILQKTYLHAARLAVRMAARLVPSDSYPAWSEAWQSDYWHWLVKSDAYTSRDGRSALRAHAVGAVRASVSAIRESPNVRERWDRASGHPLFPISIVSAALLAVLIWTWGAPETRRTLRPSALPEPSNLVLLAQSRPYLGARRGFFTAEVSLFQRHATNISGIARHQWYQAQVRLDGVERASASNIGAGFFDVLRTRPSAGQLSPAENEFVASHDFWQQRLGRASLGSELRVNGKPLRLAGVLPRDFRFLSPVEIYTATKADPPAPKDPRLARWWALKGVVARLKPGVAPEALERELRQILDDRNYGKYTYKIHASAYAGYRTRARDIYGTGLLVSLLAAILFAAQKFLRDVRAGAARGPAARYTGLLLAKIVVSLIAWFVFVVESSGVNRQGIMGGVWFGRDLWAMWLFITGSVIATIWAFRDQRSRCHVCLHRLRDPIRIGVPGQVLLETTGLELMCPKGHGIIYSPESVLGSEMEDHWLGLEEPAGFEQEPTKH